MRVSPRLPSARSRCSNAQRSQQINSFGKHKTELIPLLMEWQWQAQTSQISTDAAPRMSSVVNSGGKEHILANCCCLSAYPRFANCCKNVLLQIFFDTIVNWEIASWCTHLGTLSRLHHIQFGTISRKPSISQAALPEHHTSSFGNPADFPS